MVDRLAVAVKGPSERGDGFPAMRTRREPPKTGCVEQQPFGAHSCVPLRSLAARQTRQGLAARPGPKCMRYPRPLQIRQGVALAHHVKAPAQRGMVCLVPNQRHASNDQVCVLWVQDKRIRKAPPALHTATVSRAIVIPLFTHGIAPLLPLPPPHLNRVLPPPTPCTHCTDNAPKSINAAGSRSDSAFHFSHQFASSVIPAPF